MQQKPPPCSGSMVPRAVRFPVEGGGAAATSTRRRAPEHGIFKGALRRHCPRLLVALCLAFNVLPANCALRALRGSSSSSVSSHEEGHVAADAPFYDVGPPELRVLDDMDPVAPMDQVSYARGIPSLYGERDTALYVAPYLHPDAFPAVAGPNCTCSPGDCSCGNVSRTDTYRWYRNEPTPNSSNYTQFPADATYNAGDYWAPHVAGGIVAPEDRMPTWRYPLQAPKDAIWRLPSMAAEDRLHWQYARYVDQIEARARERVKWADESRVPCKAGDAVNASVGNMRLEATIIAAEVGNGAVTVQMAPERGVDGSVDCPVAAACTAFKLCTMAGAPCVDLIDTVSHDAFGDVQRSHACPQGRALCKTVQQVLGDSDLTKGDVVCKASA